MLADIDNFALQHNITPAAKLLWQWLKREEEGEEQEPDLQDFNKWVEKHRGKPFHRDTLKRAIAQLAELRIIRIVRAFTWRIYRLVCRPLEWLKPSKKARRRACDRALPPSNPISADDQVKQQQQSCLPTALDACTAAGIVFRPKDFDKIITYSTEELFLALNHFAVRGGHEKIRNPSGWLVECLKWQWWLDQEVYR